MTNQISSATNLTSPNLGNTQSDANKFFTNLYAVDFATSPEINDAFVAFFEKYAGNKNAGNNLAGTVLYSTIAQGLNPMQVLTDFQQLPQGQIDSYLAALLNLNRVPTSSLGTKQPATTNMYVKRAVLP